LQSGYSELLGLYPPGAGALEMTPGEIDSLLKGKGLPPMNVRGAEKINSDLG
jgi:hypothetical protein